MCVFGYLTAEARAVCSAGHTCLPARLALSWVGSLGFRVLGVSLHPQQELIFSCFGGTSWCLGSGFIKDSWKSHSIETLFLGIKHLTCP